jgi:hypothetical protein
MRNVPAVTTKILACSPRNLGRELDVRKNALSFAEGEVFFLDIPLYRTPLWTAFSRPKFHGVAPALSRVLRDRVLPACRNRNMQFVMRSVMHHESRKGEKALALLKAPAKQPKTTTLQVRLEEEVRHNLDKYAEFVDANSSYVVSETLKLLFRKDTEFKRWLGQHTNNHNLNQSEGGSLLEIAKKA